MTRPQKTLAAAALAASSIATTSSASDAGGNETKEQVEQRLQALDGKLFNAAFVECDMDVLDDLLAQDFEFYHDRDGLSYTSSAAFIEDVSRECGPEGTGMKRILVPDSLSTHMLGDYGAMQMGKHEFHQVVSDGSSIAREKGVFIHIWQRSGESSEGWQITRIVSYDHEGIE